MTCKATDSAVRVSLSDSGGTLIHSRIAAGLDGFTALTPPWAVRQPLIPR